MRTSVRNQILCKVLSCKPGPVNVEVTLGVNEIDHLVSVITRESYEKLGLEIGSEVYALVKSSLIILAVPDESLQTSARNQLTGKVSRITPGTVNTEVVIELNDGNSLAVMVTTESAQVLGIEKGVPLSALIKASHVILGID